MLYAPVEPLPHAPPLVQAVFVSCPLPFGTPRSADLISRELFRFAFVVCQQRLAAYFVCFLFLFTVKFNATCFAFVHSSHHITLHRIAFRVAFRFAFCFDAPTRRQRERGACLKHSSSAAPKSMLSFSNHPLNSNYSLRGGCVYVCIQLCRSLKSLNHAPWAFTIVIALPRPRRTQQVALIEYEKLSVESARCVCSALVCNYTNRK